MLLIQVWNTKFSSFFVLVNRYAIFILMVTLSHFWCQSRSMSSCLRMKTYCTNFKKQFCKKFNTFTCFIRFRHSNYQKWKRELDWKGNVKLISSPTYCYSGRPAFKVWWPAVLQLLVIQEFEKIISLKSSYLLLSVWSIPDVPWPQKVLVDLVTAWLWRSVLKISNWKSKIHHLLKHF